MVMITTVPMIPTTCRAARNHIKGLVLEAFFWIRDGKSRGDHRQMECCTGVGELKNISLRMAFCTLHQMFMSVGRGISASRDRILHLSSVVYLWIWGVEWWSSGVAWSVFRVLGSFSTRCSAVSCMLFDFDRWFCTGWARAGLWLRSARKMAINMFDYGCQSQEIGAALSPYENSWKRFSI